jgi:hypothetical protein
MKSGFPPSTLAGTDAMKIAFLLILVLSILSIIPYSVSAGDRTMSANAEAVITYTMDPWGNNAPGLEINLPGNWLNEKNKGPDFDVHWFSAPDGSGNIGIYVGHHPNMRKADNAQRSRHLVGEREVDFYREKGDNNIFTKALVKDFFADCKGSGVAALMLHIMINEQKSGFTQRALEALASLKKRGKN